MVLSPIREGDVLAGKYEVERVLGVGGMGVVVAARHIELDQRVAVKFLLPEIAERGDAAERFRREARAAVKITSEHVARVLDVGTLSEGVPFMVMEYLSGHDLSFELKQREQLPVSEAVDYVLQACDAVAEAHAAGIVHRDLKPGNLFLARRADGTHVVKVLDFGISKSVSGTSLDDMALTKTSALIGSPLYMSPEQMHSAKTVDARADIWSLGSILYEALAGRPPYIGESLPQLCASLLNDTQPPLAEFRADIPQGIERAVAKALQKDRAQRYQTVAELARAIAPYATANARFLADRATRVLSATGDHSVEPPALSEDEMAGTAVMSQRPTTASTLASSPGVLAGSTHSAWGSTGAPRAPSRIGRWVAIAGAGGLAAIALIAFAITRTEANADPAAPASAPVSAPSAPLPAVIEPSTPEATIAPAPIESAAPEPSAAEPPSATEPPSPRVVRPSAPRPPASAGDKGSTSTPPSGNITDFGGRR